MLEHDHVFFFGDLNYRVDGHTRHQILAELRAGRLAGLLAADQLKAAARSGAGLTELAEPAITFPCAGNSSVFVCLLVVVPRATPGPFSSLCQSSLTERWLWRTRPTFKFDVGTVGTYDTSSKQRLPAWSDDQPSQSLPSLFRPLNLCPCSTLFFIDLNALFKTPQV